MAKSLTEVSELAKKFRNIARNPERNRRELETNIKNWLNAPKKNNSNTDPYVSFYPSPSDIPFNVYGMYYFSADRVENKSAYLNFAKYDLEKEKYDKKETKKFLEIHFLREKNSHLAPIFLMSKDQPKDIHYVLFSSIEPNVSYPYVEIKPISDKEKNKGYYCEAFFPIIYQSQEADKMELLRDILYAFFYYHKIKIIVQTAKFIIKDNNLNEQDAILTVLISPFIRFPGLLNSVQDDKDDKDNNSLLNYYSTKLHTEVKEYINANFKKNVPESNMNIEFYPEINKEVLSKEKCANKKLAISSVLIFDSKRRQMNTIGCSNLHFYDFICRRLKVTCDLFKIFKHAIPNISNKFPATSVISIVDAGQRDSIMDISNCVSKSFYYDSNPGSSLCSYRTINGLHYLFFVFRTADKNSLLMNANAIAVSLRISDIIIIPVSFPPFNFIQCFEYAFTRIELLLAEKRKLTDKQKSIILQFSSTTEKAKAVYFTKIFQKTLNILGLKNTKLDYFIGYKDITDLLGIVVKETDEDSPVKEPTSNKEEKKDEKNIKTTKNTNKNKKDKNAGNKDETKDDDEANPQNKKNSSEDDDDESKKTKKKRSKKKSTKSTRNKKNSDDDDDDDDDSDSESDNDSKRRFRNQRSARRRGRHIQRSIAGNKKKIKKGSDSSSDDTDDDDDDDNASKKPEREDTRKQNPRDNRSSDNSDDDNDDNDDNERRLGIDLFMNSISAFSVVNDYRDYMDMNLFFPIGEKQKSLEYKTFMLHNEKMEEEP